MQIKFEDNIEKILDGEKYKELANIRSEVSKKIFDSFPNLESYESFNGLDVICFKNKDVDKRINIIFLELIKKTGELNKLIENINCGAYDDLIISSLNSLNGIAELTEYMRDNNPNMLIPFVYVDIVGKELGSSVTTYQKVIIEEIPYIIKELVSLIKKLDCKLQLEKRNIFKYFENKKLNKAITILNKVLELFKEYEKLFSLSIEYSYGLSNDIYFKLEGYSKTLKCIQERDIDEKVLDEIRKSTLNLL